MVHDPPDFWWKYNLKTNLEYELESSKKCFLKVVDARYTRGISMECCPIIKLKINWNLYEEEGHFYFPLWVLWWWWLNARHTYINGMRGGLYDFLDNMRPSSAEDKLLNNTKNSNIKHKLPADVNIVNESTFWLLEAICAIPVASIYIFHLNIIKISSDCQHITTFSLTNKYDIRRVRNTSVNLVQYIGLLYAHAFTRFDFSCPVKIHGRTAILWNYSM